MAAHANTALFILLLSVKVCEYIETDVCIVTERKVYYFDGIHRHLKICHEMKKTILE